MTIPNTEVQRTPGWRKQAAAQAEVTGFQEDQSWSQGQGGQRPFGIILLTGLTGLHAPFTTEEDFGFLGPPSGHNVS